MRTGDDNPARWSNVLRGVPEVDYGDRYRDHVLEVYKLYLGMADAISARRERANSFFLAVNTGLVALLSKDYFGGKPDGPGTIGALAPVAGIILCVLWNRILWSYRGLNSAKFKVVHEIEDWLPIRPFDAEWEQLGRGTKPGKYMPFTHVEVTVPWVFVLLHLVIAIATLA